MCAVAKGQDIFFRAVMPLKSKRTFLMELVSTSRAGWGPWGGPALSGQVLFRCKTSDSLFESATEEAQVGLRVRYSWFKRGSPVRKFSPSQKGMLGMPRKGVEIKTESILIVLNGSFLSLVVLAAQLKDFKQKWLRRVERSILCERRIDQIWNLDFGKDRTEGEMCNRCIRKLWVLQWFRGATVHYFPKYRNWCCLLERSYRNGG